MDQINLLNEKIENIEQTSSEKYEHIYSEYNNLKTRFDKDIGSKEDLMHKISTVDKMYKNMENDFDKSKIMNQQIKHNIDHTDEIISAIKDEVLFFETKALRSNERNSKTIVQLKVGLDSIVNEFA